MDESEIDTLVESVITCLRVFASDRCCTAQEYADVEADIAGLERLRAREAALVAQNAQAMAIVGRVAKAAVGEWNQCTLGCAPVWDGFTWRHAADCTVMKARALLEQK